MSIRVEKLPAKIWRQYAENAHLIVFDERRKAEMDRIDYALLAVDTETDTPAGYITCREYDSHSVYWAYGGAFPSVRGTNQSFPVYKKFIQWARENYQSVFTQIENTNRTYLKFALQVGFIIRGCRSWDGRVYVELALDFRDAAKVNRPPGYPDTPEASNGD